MYNNKLTLKDRLLEIMESIKLIQEWSNNRHSTDDYMLSPDGVMAFNACVMRLQVIGEHVGKLLKDEGKPLENFKQIPWLAIYDLRNIISHEYANIDEELIVSIINDDIPKLKNVVEEMQKLLWKE